MEATFRDEVRALDHSHRFGGSRRAAIAWLASLDGCNDDEAGSSFGGYLWIARLGRRVVLEDSQGFVGCQSFRTEPESERYFAALRRNYCDGLED